MRCQTNQTNAHSQRARMYWYRIDDSERCRSAFNIGVIRIHYIHYMVALHCVIAFKYNEMLPNNCVACIDVIFRKYDPLLVMRNNSWTNTYPERNKYWTKLELTANVHRRVVSMRMWILRLHCMTNGYRAYDVCNIENGTLWSAYQNTI